MMRTVMEAAGLAFWPVLSLVVFTLFAAGATAWLWRRGSKGFYEDMARIALGGPAAGDRARDAGRD
jgi:cbb3-type cytochrome oxidase subunit 3